MRRQLGTITKEKGPGHMNMPFLLYRIIVIVISTEIEISPSSECAFKYAIFFGRKNVKVL